MKKLLSSTKGKLEVKDNSYENPYHSIGTYLKAITPKKKKKKEDFLHPQTNILKTIYK